MTKFLALTLCAALTLPAHAQSRMNDVTCDDRIRLTQTLTEVLGAERQGMGLRDPETVLEVWVTYTSGDWVIVQNYANGTSCIVAIGENWEAAVPAPT